MEFGENQIKLYSSKKNKQNQVSEGNKTSIDVVVIAQWAGSDTAYITNAVPKTSESFLFTELKHPKVLIFTK